MVKECSATPYDRQRPYTPLGDENSWRLHTVGARAEKALRTWECPRLYQTSCSPTSENFASAVPAARCKSRSDCAIVGKSLRPRCIAERFGLMASTSSSGLGGLGEIKSVAGDCPTTTESTIHIDHRSLLAKLVPSGRGRIDGRLSKLRRSFGSLGVTKLPGRIEFALPNPTPSRFCSGLFLLIRSLRILFVVECPALPDEPSANVNVVHIASCNCSTVRITILRLYLCAGNKRLKTTERFLAAVPRFAVKIATLITLNCINAPQPHSDFTKIKRVCTNHFCPPGQRSGSDRM